MKVVRPEDLRKYRRSLSTVDPKYFQTVEKIVEDVKTRGDAAVLEHTRRLDHVEAADFSLFVSEAEFAAAQQSVIKDYNDIYSYFLHAAQNIKNFHIKQLQQSWEFEQDGCVFGQKISPISRTGLYVPGGLGFYPSSLVMNLIPAVVAGVQDITLASPPDPQGQLHPLLLTLARELGATRVLKAGGAQAIAALAYGTETIPKVYKITGPGNIYVALAKRMVIGAVGIDSIAGPSEVAILSDGQVSPDWLAMDLCAQAEHSEGTAVFLISSRQGEIEEVQKALEVLLPTLPRADLIRKCLEEDSFGVTVKDLDDGFDIINRIAPEHLEVMVDLPRAEILDRVENAGAIFLGKWSPVPLGDYYAGPNHVLPTNGTAVYSSPLGVYDFIKRSSYMELDQAYIRKNVTEISTMARFESLEAHARSVELRK